MVASISRFMNFPASAIEIHPGDARNTYNDLIAGMMILFDQYARIMHSEPLILLENRTGQIISNGSEIASFWKLLVETSPELKGKVGIVLDVQQLFTVTRKGFLKALDTIPLEAIRGLHIHHKHGIPRKEDIIPWDRVFNKIRLAKDGIIINPEVLRKSWVEPTIMFCKESLAHLS
jgi:hypothetical protein